MTDKKKITRRALLAGAATAASIAVLRTITGQKVEVAVGSTPGPAAASVSPVGDPTKVPGTLSGKVGTRSAFEKVFKKPSDISSRAPLQDLYGMLTPSDLHFERHHAGVPVIDPHKWELVVHGMVERPMVFTLADLKRFPSVSRICFIECSGNFRTGKEEMTPQDICGLTSQSEWTGVMLSTIFREVGVDARASWFLAEGGDAAVMTRSIPVRKGWDDIMIVYGQNGEAIRPEQGYPVRLLVPGWEGNVSIKWLRRIELSDQPFMTREETSRYTEPVKDRIRQFSFDIDARSIITFPAYPVEIPRGWVEIKGLAWSGRGRIRRVEVSTDAGRTWVVAQLQQPVLDKAHTRFRLLWNWDGQETEILSRAIDDTGYMQPTLQQLVEARGKEMGGYHMNPVTAWRIRRDGKVLFRPEKWK